MKTAVLLSSAFLLLLSACTGSEQRVEENCCETVTEAAQIIVEALEKKDWATVAEHAYSEMGVLFVPYGYVDPDEHRSFFPEEIVAFHDDTASYVWGRFDGRGNPIDKTIDEYYERFIYPVDFADVSPGEPNEQIGSGNSLNNIAVMFQPLGNISYVEYHQPGTDAYSGMDWRSLRLVFLEVGEKWRLLSIVHDQWTI